MNVKARSFFIVIGFYFFLTACVRSSSADVEPWRPGDGEVASDSVSENASAEIIVSNSQSSGNPLFTPTPDPPHAIPGLRSGEEVYYVQAGDTLGRISEKYNISVAAIAEANQITNVDVLEIGQELVIPAPQPVSTGPGFKLIPDSELVAGPLTSEFDVTSFARGKNGYLVHYEEEVDGRTLTGDEIVTLIARDFSVNPRLLLAVLDFQSRWVSDNNPRTDTLKYPLGWRDPWREGLYKQLSWAANNLNRGYYLWRVNAISSWILADNTVVPADPTINAGTAALQYFFGLLYGYQTWEKSILNDGFFAVYNDLFGYPFGYSFEPLIPKNLAQPSFQLPFEPEIVWAFTGGPHGGWGDGSAWAALDFAPFVDTRGCFSSDEWVVAMADGLITRAENGTVVQDLDQDGKEQTGWTILYLHIESQDRVKAGTLLQAGDRIGHPSCEGGVTDGTHVHIARRYNGEWIPADQGLPFVMEGWTSYGVGSEYDGTLQKGSAIIEAYNGNIASNAIKR